jgi:branched-chain amino acid transport system substrate-binding protein
MAFKTARARKERVTKMEGSTKKLVRVLSLLLIVALALSGCGGGAPSGETPPEKVLRVGVMGPFTGPAARTGDEFKGSAQMAFEEIDYKVGDYKIELVWIDSQSDPEKATRAYEEAILRHGIQAGVLNWHSSVAVACMEVTAKHKVPHFFGYGATEVVNEKYASDPEKYSYWLKSWPSPAKLTVAYATALEEIVDTGKWTPKNKKAAVCGEDTDWGRSFGGAIRKDLENIGWTVVTEEYFPIGETEFYPLLTRFRDLGVEIVASTATSAPAFAAFVKQGREVNLNALVIADGLGWIGEWYELSGEMSDYVLDQIPGFTTPEAKEFAETFESKWGIKPSPSAGGLSYDSSRFFIKILQDTLAEYGELNSENIHKFAMDNIKAGTMSFTDGIIMEEYKFTPESIPDPVVGKGYFIFPVLQYFGGEPVVIWPDEWKEADIEIPPYMQ